MGNPNISSLFSNVTVAKTKPSAEKAAPKGSTGSAPLDANVKKTSADSLHLSPKPYNSLQRHGAYFDLDNDHKVTLSETIQGLKDMGLPSKEAYLLAPIVNAGLALPHGGLVTIDLDAIRAAADPTTPGAFDRAGQFDPEKFEKMFTYDRGKTGSLSEAEVGALIDDSEMSDYAKFRTKAGYGLLFKLGSDTTKPELDANGEQVRDKAGNPKTAPAMSRERLQAFFDGSIFHDIAAAQGHPHAVRDGLNRSN